MLSNTFTKSVLGKMRPVTLMTARPCAYFSAQAYQNILVDKRDDGVAVVTLNRPEVNNALNFAVFEELNDALTSLDRDVNFKAIVLTGTETAFAADPELKELVNCQWPDTYMTDFLTWWDQISTLKTPLIGAVNGFALGAGTELAMMCDIIIAGEKAELGQPELNFGIIPGMGATQRLTRAVGKSRAMEWILTGDNISVDEAAQRGLISRVVPCAQLVDEAIAIGQKIAKKSAPSIAMAKECVNQAEELGLAQGLRYERRMFQSTFGTKDQKEGMAAFTEKRKPNWTNN